MYVLKGKYNIAKIMLPENEYLDETTTMQIYSFLAHPAFKGNPIVIMPDSHAGKGSCIGFTMPLNEYVIPNIVGVDIGCGMLACEISGTSIDFEKLDKFIRKNIPNGHSINETEDRVKHITKNELDEYKKLSTKIGQTVDVIKSIGSLGGGNHFIEIDKSNDKFYLIIHSGSRNLGLKVAEYHTKIAKSLMKEFFIEDAYAGLEFLPMEKGGKDYLEDMAIAQRYASINRKIILKTIMEGFFQVPNKEWKNLHFECVHNYINFADNVIRKGSISSYENEKVIIPLNMKDGIIFGKGKANKDWNFSAPHGAGRVLSRKKAKEKLDLNEAIESMSGIWTSSLNKSTLDEAPKAYKNSQMIIDAISETVDIDFVAKPVYNFKAN